MLVTEPETTMMMYKSRYSKALDFKNFPHLFLIAGGSIINIYLYNCVKVLSSTFMLNNHILYMAI
jgi:hypothetical protein